MTKLKSKYSKKETPTLTAYEKMTTFTDFVTDGCSMSPDMVFCECCIEHDVVYATGIVSRARGDAALRDCIKKKGFPILSWVYWIGVRLFGWVPFYFGNSQKYRQEYQELIAKEREAEG